MTERGRAMETRTEERPENPCIHWDHCDCETCMAECEAAWAATSPSPEPPE